MSYMSTSMARHHGASTAAEVQDRAVTIRPSSTANFYVDSEDKASVYGSGDFTINKKQSLFNGFFSRIALAEVFVDWGLPNVAKWWGNNTITVVNGATGITIGPVSIPDGFYTAIQCLRAVAAAINAEAAVLGDPLTLEVEFQGGVISLVSTGVGTDPFYFFWIDGVDTPYSLARQLFTTAQLAGAAVQNTEIVCASPRLLGTTYIDFVSPQLTYNQDLKDATTSDFTRDVIYRWYFAYDNMPQTLEKFLATFPATAAPAVQLLTDTNLPILEGYNPFVLRRALPYPKQIAWSPDQPIGQVSFQVYDDRGRLINTANFPWGLGYGGANFQFQMSMLLSEN